MKTVWRVFRYLKRYPALALGTLACAITSTLMVIVFPGVTKWVIDDALRQHHPEKLFPLITIAFLAFLLQHCCQALQIILNTAFEQRVIFDLRSDLYSHIQLLPLKWFDNRATGDLMTRVIEDVNAVERLLIEGIEQGVVGVLQVVIVFAVMLYFNARLALLALIPLPLLVAGALTYTLTAHRRYRLQRRAASAMNALLHDNLSGIRQVKSFARENEEHARFNGVSDEVRRVTLVVNRVWAIYSPSMSMFQAMGAIIVLAFGSHAVLIGTMQLGDLMAFLMLIAFLYDPIGRLHQLNRLMLSGRAAGERVFEILDEANEPSWTNDYKPVRLAGDIRYENVNFHYGKGLAALREISWQARRGKTIALVGPTGAGKSTIASLLPRFYELPDGDGKIFVDGKEIRDYHIRALRENIGLVTQESFLFNGSIRENLLMGKSGATDDELLRAIEVANAREFVEQLPDKLGTIVGERGVKLSVGEKQRLSIARALLKDPPILILDEATASVDTATERLIQEALEHLIANRTSIVIAHRLSTIVNADQILVLDHGRIVERGTHEELLARGGRYARLCEQSLLESRREVVDIAANVGEAPITPPDEQMPVIQPLPNANPGA